MATASQVTQATVGQQVKDARRVSTPLIAITTADQPATIASVMESLQNGTPVPALSWDCVRGLTTLNQAGKSALASAKQAMGVVDDDPSFAFSLVLVDRLPERAIVFMQNAHRFLSEVVNVQAIANLRDSYKQDQRTLVLTGPEMPLPSELQQDVMVIDEPLPDAATIRKIIATLDEQARISKRDLPKLDEDLVSRAVDALAGLSAFPIEQAVALSLVQHLTLHIDSLWARKKAYVEQTDGISIYRGDESLDDLRGLDGIINWGECTFTGRQRPKVIVVIDEIEKAMAGTGGGDLSGTSDDQLQQILTFMQDNFVRGLIAYGGPGTGKSHFAKGLAAKYGVPCIYFDLGGMKNSLIGGSEGRIRQALKIILAIAGKGGAMFIGTCNGVQSLDPPLLRRFDEGIYYFPPPTADGRKAVWPVWINKLWQDEAKPAPHTFDDTGWTGADIRNCCLKAWRFNISLDEAAKFVVPVCKTNPEAIQRACETAHGRFISAQTGSLYEIPEAPIATKAQGTRRFNA